MLYSKTTSLLFIIIFLAGSLTLNAQNEDLILEFTARHTCAHVPLDSILIENITQGGSTSLYYPDTALVILITSIPDHPYYHNDLTVKQNYPNPFSEKTNIDVFVPEADRIKIYVHDLKGQVISSYSTFLVKGLHHFVFQSGNQQAYIFTAQSSTQASQLLMMQTGENKSDPGISYIGKSFTDKSESQVSSDFDYSIGDVLRFTGFVTDLLGAVDSKAIIDTPDGSQDYLFDIANEEPSQPSEIFGQTFVNAFETDLLYEVLPEAGVTYFWEVPDNWEIVSGQGTNAITVTAGDNSGNISVSGENNCGVGPEQTLPVEVVEEGVFVCGSAFTFSHGDEHVTYGTIERGGLCWMDRHLGAEPMPFVPVSDASNGADPRLFGDLYQWGRLTDGHQNRESATTYTLSETDVPGHDYFIIINNSPYDWRVTQNNDLWQGEEGINNPCPEGWRVPTDEELTAEILSWDAQNPAGAFSSPLRWPVGGYRNSMGDLLNEGSWGLAWSTTVSGTGVRMLYYFGPVATIVTLNRAFGVNVRCVRELQN